MINPAATSVSTSIKSSLFFRWNIKKSHLPYSVCAEKVKLDVKSGSGRQPAGNPVAENPGQLRIRKQEEQAQDDPFDPNPA